MVLATACTSLTLFAYPMSEHPRIHLTISSSSSLKYLKGPAGYDPTYHSVDLSTLYSKALLTFIIPIATSCSTISMLVSHHILFHNL